jgi:hypothetical protein
MPKPLQSQMAEGLSRTRTRRLRVLRFDRLEERRLMAGLEVLVFEDVLSARQVSNQSVPVAEKVVYVDLNADGNHQSSEPLGVTDANGKALFSNLQPGSYLVRLLGQNPSTAQTTNTVPAPSGTWLGTLGIQSTLQWETDTLGWFQTENRLAQIDTASGRIVDSLSLGGTILSTTMVDNRNGVAIVGSPTSSRLVAFHLGSLTAVPSSGLTDGLAELLHVGGQTLVRRNAVSGSGLYGVDLSSPTSVSTTSLSTTSAISRLPVIDGLSRSATVHPLGASELAIVEPIADGSRISIYQRKFAGWDLTSERIFAETVRFSSGSNDGKMLALESSVGLFVVSNTSGLPVLSQLSNAAGPSAFDSSRGTLLTTDRSSPSRLLSWSLADWTRGSDVLLSDTQTREQASRTTLSLGFLGDTLIGVRDGSLYRHPLNLSAPTSAALSDGDLQRIAIGIRNRSSNSAPSLGSLARRSVGEDTPLVISDAFMQSAAADADGDRMFYVLRRSPSIGSLSWSTSTGGVYAPNANANGSDQFVVQAYDGRDWSLPQTFGIQVLPVNDAPTKIDVASTIQVPELIAGAEIASLRVVDPDGDSNYRFVVSDGRFQVQNGWLSLAPGVALNFEDEPSVVITVWAHDPLSSDSIHQTLTVQVKDQNDPPLGIVITGNGQIPEKRPGYVVGNIGVIDPDRSEVYDFTVSDSRFEVVDHIVRVKASARIVYVDPGWIDLTFTATSRSNGATLSRSDRLRVIKDSTPYHNDTYPEDVDGDGTVSPLDPLIIVNYINNHGAGNIRPNAEGESMGNLDVDGDGAVTPLDILIVINALNRPAPIASGEGSSPRGGSGLIPEGESNTDSPSKPFGPAILPPVLSPAPLSPSLVPVMPTATDPASLEDALSMPQPGSIRPASSLDRGMGPNRSTRRR